MKRIFLYISIAFCFLGCNHKDLLWTEVVDDLDGRVTSLELICSEMNTNIAALQMIVDVLQSNDYITGIVEIKRDGVVIGYTITFGKYDPITIYHGQDGNDGQNGKDGQDGADGKDGQNGADGKDGITPVIGVAQDTDGVYYWTLNGEWLLDDHGNKLPVSGKDGQNGANGSNGQDGADGKDGQDGEDGKDGADGQDGKDGQDGITPQLKIEDGYWYISYDNGATWTQLGKATGENGQDGKDGADGEDGKDGADGEDGKDGQNGADGKDGQDGDSMFQSVTQDENYVYFTLADGTVIKIAKGNDNNDHPNGDDIINFRDLAVKSALLKLGVDTTGDGEISYGEASKYQNTLSFEKNTAIYSFKELQYFTGVTAIVDNAFKGCTRLFEIILPENITSIGTSTFNGCSSLTSIIIPENVTSIGSNAFYGCSLLSKINIPNNLINIGTEAFAECPNLPSFTFPENYDGAAFVFGYCPGGNSASVTIALPKTIYWNTIDYQKSFVYLRENTSSYSISFYGIGGAYYYTNMYSNLDIVRPNNAISIIFGNKVQHIPNYLCAYLDGLTEIHIPNSVITIGDNAFKACRSLNTVTIGDAVKIINPKAFEECSSITSITLPNSIAQIGDYAFSKCSSLQYLYCKATTPPSCLSNSFPSSIKIIYVPKESVDEYKVLWSYYADKIVGYDFE